MTISYKTEGRMELAANQNPGMVAVAQWQKNGGIVRICQGKAVLILDQRQLLALINNGLTIWDDIGPEKLPQSA